ncbi:MAG: hypothetical protein ACYTFG_15940, partial [Planctomycetota bacterium]
MRRDSAPRDGRRPEEWVLYTTGFDEGLDEVTGELAALYEDRKRYETILELLEKDLVPLDRRRVEILARWFEPYHLSAEANKIQREMRKLVNALRKILNTFRFRVDGVEVRSTEIFQTLASDPD